MIKILFFARLREQLGISQLQLETAPTNIHALVDMLESVHGHEFAKKLRAANIIVACNHHVVQRSHGLKEGDEVAFYPPVTGG